MTDKVLGVAIDIGTTTIALHLTDMETNERLTTVSGINVQIPYGADVTSRIKYCAENGHGTLTKIIREQINAMIKEACSSTGMQTKNIEIVSIAANTIMQHLAAGYSPVDMGVAPFTPVSLFGEELPAWDDLPVAENATVYYTPAISAYVGGDITAGLMAAGFETIQDPAIFLDIGTNGEIVLKHKGTYYCCATAAGPAFEGAEITMGMAAVTGAVDHVKWKDGIEFSTIDNAKAVGLCGSGLLDMLAVLLDTGAVDETGRLDRDRYWLTGQKREDQIPGTEREPSTTGEDGVYITAGDIRKLQLAKAAIAAGIQVLLHFAGVSEAEIKLLALAGGFGSYMDLNSAARIGLFPKSLLPAAKAFGNTAGEGAAMVLDQKDAGTRLDIIRAHCEYIELSTMTFFNDKFVDQMAFEE